MRTDIDLDHVAVATEQTADAWPRYAGDLAGQWLGGGATAGFSSFQLTYANGMKVEVLEPYAVEQNDFLRRFLDRNGPGAHHLTFKVGDLESALEDAEAAGYRPVGVDLSSPWWKEAFLHPKDAPGIVVQLAQSAEGGDWGSQPRPEWLPAPRTPEPATLVRVTHAVADLAEGTRLFVDLLDGAVLAQGEGWVDLAWKGPGRIRLLSPAADGSLTTWLDGRAGRLHHLAFAADRPDAIDGARPVGDGLYEVAPDDNLGVRLLLSGLAAPARS